MLTSFCCCFTSIFPPIWLIANCLFSQPSVFDVKPLHDLCSLSICGRGDRHRETTNNQHLSSRARLCVQTGPAIRWLSGQPTATQMFRLACIDILPAFICIIEAISSLSRHATCFRKQKKWGRGAVLTDEQQTVNACLTISSYFQGKFSLFWQTFAPIKENFK